MFSLIIAHLCCLYSKQWLLELLWTQTKMVKIFIIILHFLKNPLSSHRKTYCGNGWHNANFRANECPRCGLGSANSRIIPSGTWQHGAAGNKKRFLFPEIYFLVNGYAGGGCSNIQKYFQHSNSFVKFNFKIFSWIADKQSDSADDFSTAKWVIIV